MHKPTYEALEARVAELEGQLRDRITAEKEMRKLSRAVAASPASVVITDKNGTIEYVNPKFESLTGYSLAEAVGKNPSILNAGVQTATYYANMWRTLSEGGEWRGEFCNRKKNGELYWEMASISPIRDKDGDITHFVAVKEDITERKRMTEELSRAKMLAEGANRAKSDFLANMSHELRTPLNAVIGFSEVLKEGYFGNLNEKQAEYVTDILSSGTHLLSLINDILDLSKIESGKMEIEPSRFRVKDILEKSLFMVKQKAMKHGITLSNLYPEDLAGLEMTADERKLKQVLFNLLSNATKFTPDGGAIEIRTRPVNPAENGDLPGVEISVRDTGIGLTEEELVHVFDEFYQTGVGMAAKTPGTGLGLPLTRRFVELHGGTVWVKSPGRGKGSVFGFILPLEPVRDLKKTSAKHQVPARKGAHPIEGEGNSTAYFYAPEPEMGKSKASLSGREEMWLQEKLTLFQQMIDQSLDAIYLIEEKTGQVIDINEQACRALGYTREELLRMKVVDIEATLFDDRHGWAKHVGEVRFEKGKIIEGHHLRKDGTLFPVEVSVQHVHYRGQDYIIAVVRDVTERKRAQASILTAKQEAERANLAKSDFLASMSHELRTPLPQKK